MLRDHREKEEKYAFLRELGGGKEENFLVGSMLTVWSQLQLEIRPGCLCFFRFELALSLVCLQRRQPPRISELSELGMADNRIAPDFHQVNLEIEGFIKGELGIKLDKGELSLPSSQLV